MAVSGNSTKVQEGEEARGVMGVVRPKIQKRISEIVDSLVSGFRGGDINHNAMVGGIGGISELKALEDSFTTKIKVGERAAQEEQDE